MTAPRSLRSRSARSNASSSSSVVKARAAAKLQIARLKVKQLQDQQILQRERAERQQRRELEHAERQQRRKLEETEARQRREREEAAAQETTDILSTSHELEQASFEHQVLEEELNRGGYIPEAEDEEWRLEASSVKVSNRPSPNIELNKIGIVSNRPITNNAQNLQSSSTAPAPSVHALKPKKIEESACKNIPSSSGVLSKDIRFENNPAASSSSFNLTDFTFTRPVTNAGQNLPATSTTPAHSAKVSQPKKIEEVVPEEIPSVSSRFTLSKNIPFESKPVASSASCLKTTTTNLDEALRSFSSVIRDGIHRPPLELIKFDGDPMKYSRFMTTFETTVEQVELDDQRRLLYLLQHCEGKAKNLIEFCILLDPAVGYQKAKETLKENYGRKNVIARAYMNRLADGPKIKLDD